MSNRPRPRRAVKVAAIALGSLVAFGACSVALGLSGEAEPTSTSAPSEAPSEAPAEAVVETESPSEPETEPTSEPVDLKPDACTPASDALVAHVATFLDPASDVRPTGEAVVYAEGDAAFFVAVEIVGPGVDSEVAVFATPSVDPLGVTLPASNMAEAFALPGMRTAEQVWSVDPIGESVRTAEECLS